MKYEKVIDECAKLVPLVIWGAIDENQRIRGCTTYGFDMHFLGENHQEFINVVEKISSDKQIGTYYVSKDKIKNYLLSLIREVHSHGTDAAKNNDTLKKQWATFIDNTLTTYHIIFPIYGVIVNDDISIGSFIAYNTEGYRRFLANYQHVSVADLEKFSILKDGMNFLRYDIKAKDPNRARELSLPIFELFEYAAKFLLWDSQLYDIGIFNYRAWSTSSSLVLSKTSYSGHFDSKGASVNIPVTRLVDFPNAKPFWDMITRYIEAKTTMMENQTVNAIKFTGKANSSYSSMEKYVQYVFALEALLAHTPQKEIITPSLSYHLAEYASFIVGENVDLDGITKKELRQKIFKDVKKVYANRSKIVHGSDSFKKFLDVAEARELVYKVIISTMRNKEIMKFTSPDNLQQWIDNLKFS